MSELGYYEYYDEQEDELYITEPENYISLDVSMRIPLKGVLAFRFSTRRKDGLDLFQEDGIFQRGRFHFHVKLTGDDPSGPILYSIEIPDGLSAEQIQQLKKQRKGRNIIRGGAKIPELELNFASQNFLQRQGENTVFAKRNTVRGKAAFDPRTNTITGVIEAGFLQPGKGMFQKNAQLVTQIVIDGDNVDVWVPSGTYDILGSFSDLLNGRHVKCQLLYEQRQLIITRCAEADANSTINKGKSQSCNYIVRLPSFPYQFKGGDGRPNSYKCQRSYRDGGNVIVINLQRNIKVVKREDTSKKDDGPWPIDFI